MLRYLNKALLACIIILFCTPAFSQFRRKQNEFLKGLKIQPKAGLNMFFGDLVSESRMNYVFGVVGEKELMPFLNARIDVNYGSMKGTQINPDYVDPYATFENTFIQFNVGASFRPLDLAYGLFKQRLFNPYVIGEFGIIQFSATEYWGPGGPTEYVEPGSVWREVSGITPGISFGGGVNFYYSSHLSFTLEFIGTKAFSDQLDGHDEWYARYGEPEQYTVTTDASDFFYVGTVGVTYLFDDSQWKNSPKYNRKAYLRTRSLYKSNRGKKYKRPSKRKTKRYRRR